MFVGRPTYTIADFWKQIEHCGRSAHGTGRLQMFRELHEISSDSSLPLVRIHLLLSDSGEPTYKKGEIPIFVLVIQTFHTPICCRLILFRRLGGGLFWLLFSQSFFFRPQPNGHKRKVITRHPTSCICFLKFWKSWKKFSCHLTGRINSTYLCWLTKSITQKFNLLHFGVCIHEWRRDGSSFVTHFSGTFRFFPSIGRWNFSWEMFPVAQVQSSWQRETCSCQGISITSFPLTYSCSERKSSTRQKEWSHISQAYLSRVRSDRWVRYQFVGCR